MFITVIRTKPHGSISMFLADGDCDHTYDNYDGRLARHRVIKSDKKVIKKCLKLKYHSLITIENLPKF